MFKLSSKAKPTGFIFRGMWPTTSHEFDNLDIPRTGEWLIALSKFGFMFSFQTRGRWLFRVGTFRYDYVGNFYTFPTLALKKQR